MALIYERTTQWVVMRSQREWMHRSNPVLRSGLNKLKSAGDHRQTWSTLIRSCSLSKKRSYNQYRGRKRHKMMSIRRGRLRVKSRLNPSPSWNRKGTKQSPQKHTMSLRTSSTPSQMSALAYSHSSQVAGFGVQQGLFKVLLSVRCLLGDLQRLCHSTARQCTSGIALVWIGTELSA